MLQATVSRKSNRKAIFWKIGLAGPPERRSRGARDRTFDRWEQLMCQKISNSIMFICNKQFWILSFKQGSRLSTTHTKKLQRYGIETEEVRCKRPTYRGDFRCDFCRCKIAVILLPFCGWEWPIELEDKCCHKSYNMRPTETAACIKDRKAGVKSPLT